MTTKELYQRCQVGLKLLWSNRLEDAEEYFEAEKDINPRFALHYAEVSVFRTLITELSSDRDESARRMNNTIKLAEKQIKLLDSPHYSAEDKQNHLLDARVILADAHILMAGLMILEEARVKGVLSLRKGWKLYKQILASIPSHLLSSTQTPPPDSPAQSNGKIEYNQSVISSLKFGAGLFYFILSFIPPGVIQKAAALAGFSGGNKELGLQFLADTRIADHSVRSHMASIVLALNLLLVTVAPDEETTMRVYNQAEQFIQIGLQQFGTGCVFQATAALSAMEANKVADALKFAQAAIDNSKHITDYPAVFLRLLSNCYAMDYNWEALMKTLQRIVDLAAEGEKQGKFKNPWSLTWNSIRLAAAYALVGQADKAKKLFNEVSSAKKVDKWSETVIQLASKYLRTGGHYSKLEIMYVTQHYEKSLKFATPEKKKKMLDLIEKIAEKTPGSLAPLFQDAQTPKGTSLRDIFASKSSKIFNDVKVDNRLSYLSLKGLVLKYNNQPAEAAKYFQEIIDNSSRLVDKMHYALSLLQMAKLHMKTDPAKSMKLLHAVQGFDFMFDSGLKSQARAYMKFLAKGNAELAIGIEELNEEPSAPEEELDDGQAAKELEKMLNE